MKQRLPFAHRHALLDGREGEQAVETPHSAEAVRVTAMLPRRLEFAQRTGNVQAVPRVRHVEQVAALRAGDANLVDAAGGAACRRDALLISSIGRLGASDCSYLPQQGRGSYRRGSKSVSGAKTLIYGRPEKTTRDRDWPRSSQSARRESRPWPVEEIGACVSPLSFGRHWKSATRLRLMGRKCLADCNIGKGSNVASICWPVAGGPIGAVDVRQSFDKSATLFYNNGSRYG